MHYEPRNVEADAKFIEAGGLKNWGCAAFLVSILVLCLLLIPVHAFLAAHIGDPAALWTSFLLLLAVIAAFISLLLRSRRKQRIAQEQAWQQEMK